MNPFAIASVGMVTPAAEDASGSVACIYTDVRRFDDLPTPSELQVVGAKTSIPHEVVGFDRLVQLGGHALWEAVDVDTASESIGLVVCAPAEADEPGVSGPPFLAALAAEAELHLAPQASRVFASGRDAIFDALPFALAALAQSAVATVCLLGVDSLVSKPRLRRFLEGGGAIGAGHPALGEAAAAILLTRRPTASTAAMLVGLGVSKQRFLDRDGPPHPGRGLLAAIARATAEAEVEQPVFAGLAHDMAGTAGETEELAWTRTGSIFARSPEMASVFPHVVTADAGAAMGVLAIATSAFLLQKAAWRGLGVCCLTGSGQRGAVVVAPSPKSAPCTR